MVLDRYENWSVQNIVNITPWRNVSNVFLLITDAHGMCVLTSLYNILTQLLEDQQFASWQYSAFNFPRPTPPIKTSPTLDKNWQWSSTYKLADQMPNICLLNNIWDAILPVLTDTSGPYNIRYDRLSKTMQQETAKKRRSRLPFRPIRYRVTKIAWDLSVSENA